MATITVANGEAGVEYRTLDWLGSDYAFGNDGSAWTRKPRNQYGKPTEQWHGLMGFLSRDGYRRLLLRIAGAKAGRKKFFLHRLVCEAFHGPPPFVGAKALHKDDFKPNNSAGNLYWGDTKQNHADRCRNGHSTKSECHPRATLTNLQVREIRAIHKTGAFTVTRIAEVYGRPRTIIGAVTTGKNWTHLPQAGDIPSEQCKQKPIRADAG